MAQQMESSMKKISVAKVVLNMGVGKSGEPIEKAKLALQQIAGQQPSPRFAKATQRDWGVHKGEPIGVAVTVRKEAAIQLEKAKQTITKQQSDLDEFKKKPFFRR